MHMRVIGITLTVLLVAVGSAYAQQQTHGIVGNWEVWIADHEVTALLELEQEGHAVSGNFQIPNHGDLFVDGEFNEGVLQLQSVEGSYMTLSIQGQVEADGTLMGKLSGDIGEMGWTAHRAEGR